MNIYISLNEKNTILQWSTASGIGDIEVELSDDHEFFEWPCNWFKFEDGEVLKRTQEEIEAINNEPKPLSEIEQLKKQQADLVFQLMLNGVI